MKHATPSKKHRGQRQAEPRPAPASSGRFSLARWALPAICLILAGGSAWAFCEFVIWNRIPPELAGKWVVVEGPQDGATFDFYRNGTMVGRVNVGGKQGIVNAQIQVEGQTIHSTTTNPRTGRDETRPLYIRTLTAKQLVLEDEQKQLLKMERAE